VQAPADRQRVFFGAVVTVEDEEGEQRRYQLVGPDETEPEQGRLSYLSPIGKALMRRAIGDIVVLRRPAGEVEMTILSIEYGIWLQSPA